MLLCLAGAPTAHITFFSLIQPSLKAPFIQYIAQKLETLSDFSPSVFQLSKAGRAGHTIVFQKPAEKHFHRCVFSGILARESQIACASLMRLPHFLTTVTLEGRMGDGFTTANLQILPSPQSSPFLLSEPLKKFQLPMGAQLTCSK